MIIRRPKLHMAGDIFDMHPGSSQEVPKLSKRNLYKAQVASLSEIPAGS